MSLKEGQGILDGLLPNDRLLYPHPSYGIMQNIEQCYLEFPIFGITHYDIASGECCVSLHNEIYRQLIPSENLKINLKIISKDEVKVFLIGIKKSLLLGWVPKILNNIIIVHNDIIKFGFISSIHKNNNNDLHPYFTIARMFWEKSKQKPISFTQKRIRNLIGIL